MTDFTRPSSGFRFVQTQFGDTLQLVALRELGDAGEWASLAWFNRLVPPYLTDDVAQVRDGVVLTGDMVKVPAAHAMLDAALKPAEVFLADCALERGAFQFADGDFAIVSGRGNLHQAISHRIATDHSDLLFHGGYGANLGRLIGTVGGPILELVAEAYVREELLKDDRVRSVSRVVATTQGDRLSISIDLVPITGVEINVTKVV